MRIVSYCLLLLLYRCFAVCRYLFVYVLYIFVYFLYFGTP